MGVFLQTALFPGCAESAARGAVETAAKNPAFHIDLGLCKYAQNYEGTQVLIEGDSLGFATLAKVLSDLSGNPVMLLYIYDGDFWGYDFYGGQEEDHYRRTVSRPECDPQCQRLAVLAAFCVFWLKGATAWGFLDYATYEPLYGSCEKPTDVYVLRARAALTDFTKRHRAIKDLNRLIELDPANRTLYQAEIRRWGGQERAWEEQVEPWHETFRQQWAEQKRQEEEREARRLQLILEKRRKKKP